MAERLHAGAHLISPKLGVSGKIRVPSQGSDAPGLASLIDHVDGEAEVISLGHGYSEECKERENVSELHCDCALGSSSNNEFSRA